jgi:hypothetical protein
MNQEMGALVQIENDPFAPPPDVFDSTAWDGPLPVPRPRLSQVLSASGQATNLLPYDVGPDFANNRFYFRQFWHEETLTSMKTLPARL